MSDSERNDIEKIVESNAKAIQALSQEAADNHRRAFEEIQALKSVTEFLARSIQALADTMAESNRQLAAQIAESNRQLAEHIGRNAGAIQELSVLVTRLARIVSDHFNDNQRHNQP